MTKDAVKSEKLVHVMPIPLTDTAGNQHDVLYEQQAGGLGARYVHLPTCWCKRSQAAFS
jgi:hypothetical protein